MLGERLVRTAEYGDIIYDQPNDTIFCQKIVQSLKNSALMSFASTFYEKNHRDMLIFSQKSVDAVKTTPYYGLKKSIGYPFLYDFH